MNIISEIHAKAPVDMPVLDMAVAFVGLLVAVASVALQWRHFKKSNPPREQAGGGGPPSAAAHPRSRWKMMLWRDVRATFFLAILSFVMVVLIVLFHSAITLVSLASLLFWMGMFFYNLWIGQWHAWRLATKRRR